jgi:hypothetical protein
MAYFFKSLTKNIKGYMAFSIAYIILAVLFGSLVFFPFTELYYVDATGQM